MTEIITWRMKRTLFLSLSSEEWSLSSSEERLASCSSFSSSIYGKKTTLLLLIIKYLAIYSLNHFVIALLRIAKL
jgi:hypothetical protein